MRQMFDLVGRAVLKESRATRPSIVYPLGIYGWKDHVSPGFSLTKIFPNRKPLFPEPISRLLFSSDPRPTAACSSLSSAPVGVPIVASPFTGMLPSSTQDVPDANGISVINLPVEGPPETLANLAKPKSETVSIVGNAPVC